MCKRKLLNLTYFELIQIEQAAQGCISGTLEEWPHLYKVLQENQIKLPKETQAIIIKDICQAILLLRKIAKQIDKGIILSIY